MPNTTEYGDISPRTAASAAKKLLERGQSMLVTERFGQTDPQEAKKGKTRKWRRYNSLQRATTPLAEGVTPSGQKLTYTDVTATLEQYGDLVETTDVVQDTHEDPVLQEMSELCGEQSAETIEVIRIAVLKGGSNVFYANGVSARASVDSPPLRGDFRKIKRAFKRAKAREITKIVKASPNISTEPVEAAYFAMGHTDLESDIRNITGFLPVKQYADPGKALPGEIGSVESMRIILTDLFESWETSGASGTTYLSGGVEVSGAAQCDVYPIIVVAQNAYGIVPLQGKKKVKVSVKNPEEVSKSDPLGQRGFVSWKTYQAAAILNQQWLARYEVACTASPS
jgi:N4-gp56 family major capsid protein